MRAAHVLAISAITIIGTPAGAPGFNTSAEDNSRNEYGGEADLWAYLEQFRTDGKKK